MNRRNAFSQPLPLAPAVYDREYLNKLVRAWNAYVIDSVTPGDVVASSLLLLGIPATGYGLVNGAVWADDTGVLRAVQPGQAFSPSMYVRLAPGQVTV